MPSRASLAALVLGAATFAFASSTSSPPSDPSFERSPGRCAMRDSCGRKGAFGGEIPCPDNGSADQHDNDVVYRSTLAQVCGDDFPTTTCCTLSQLSTLQASLAQADPLIASCPACRSNFRRFYCHFTCSPDQSTFLTVTETQMLDKDGEEKEAVKEVEFSVSEKFGSGFFDSCKNIKFSATNGLAMDLLGGGATDWLSFLRYMGQVRALGSPFQINFPSPSTAFSNLTLLDPPTPLSLPPISCASPNPSERCACPDCPGVCAALPPILSPREKKEKAHRRCHIGRMDCFPFALVMIYTALLVLSTAALAVKEARGRWGAKGAGAIRLGGESSDDDEAAAGGGDEEHSLGLGTWNRLRHRLSFRGWTRPPVEAAQDVDVLGPEEIDEEDVDRVVSRGVAGMSRSRSGSGLVGARAQPGELDGGGGRAGRRRGDSNPDSTSSRQSQSFRSSPSQRLSSHGVSLSIDSDAAFQPRTYPLNTLLSRTFYRLGLFCASRPLLSLFLGLVVCGVANLGWARFEVERDPVNLWVPKGSEVAQQKARFEEAFGPFYRTEQVFFSVAPARSRSIGDDSDEEVEEAAWAPVDAPVLSFDTLHFLLSVESDIRALRSSPSNLSLTDLCFAPTSPSSPPQEAGYCVVQSPLGYFGNDLSGVTEETWASQLDGCAKSPASCLPPFGQPLNPKLVLSSPAAGAEDPHAARAAILTYVLAASLDPTLTARAEEWESALSAYLLALSAPDGPAAQRGIKVSYSTGLSLEEELNAATNTDVPVVVVSYLLMFVYVAVALGGSASAVGRLLLRGSVAAGKALGRAGRSGWRKTRRLVTRDGGIKLGEEEEETERAARRGIERRGIGLGAYVRRQLLVESKFSLGLVGILIVLLSVSTSVALCSLAGVKVTLIVAEVIPFLVLAIGVDNVFLLVHTLAQQNARAYAASSRHLTTSTLGGGGDAHTRSLSLDDPGLLTAEEDDEDDLLPVPERVARTLARMGPSILLSASCQCVAFALGILVGMPAVRAFAIYAAGAVLVNSLLQVTLFVSVMALDLRRVEANRIDFLPILKLPASSTSLALPPSVPRPSFLARFIRTYYAPTLLLRPVKYLVLAAFSGLFVLSWIGARHIQLGLDQRLALPASSYLVDYFNALDAYLDVGPPVYFVVEGVNQTSLGGVKEMCGRFSTCEPLSLANVLEAERKRPESSYLAEPPAVWVDDFIQYLNPALEDCCRVNRRTGEFCGPNESEFACKPCFEDREPAWSPTLDGLPDGDELVRYLTHWLDSPTDESCPLGGKASYSSALALSDNDKDEDRTVELSHFRTYHTPLKSQDDYIEAFAAAQRISKDLSKRTGGKVWPYSVFYVFFEAYASIWSTTREVLTLALFAVFLVTALLLGSFRTAAVVTLTSFLSLFTVIGAMGAWSIMLNPLSLVNLTVSIGIAVEFSAHLARAFMGANGGGKPFGHPLGAKDREERAAIALDEVGASVVSGILATKLVGVLTLLLLTRSELLKIFYARMWLVLVLSSALHGLVLLPVLLSFFGGHGYALTSDDVDGGWITTSVLRRYERENLFHDDDDASSLVSDEY
ncbi:hypothetical protein JCM8097_008841 [Rhodosporidiobolus ruineniae]